MVSSAQAANSTRAAVARSISSTQPHRQPMSQHPKLTASTVHPSAVTGRTTGAMGAATRRRSPAAARSGRTSALTRPLMFGRAGIAGQAARSAGGATSARICPMTCSTVTPLNCASASSRMR